MSESETPDTPASTNVPDTDAAWFDAHLDAYLAGGLDPAERERFETIARNNAGAAAALGHARAADARLRDIFSGDRPSPDLEERLVSIATRPAPRFRPAEDDEAETSPPRLHPVFRLIAGVAALFVLGFVGSFVGGKMMGAKFPKPPNVGLPGWASLPGFADSRATKSQAEAGRSYRTEMAADPAPVGAAGADVLAKSVDEFSTKPLSEIERSLKEGDVRVLTNELSKASARLKDAEDRLAAASVPSDNAPTSPAQPNVHYYHVEENEKKLKNAQDGKDRSVLFDQSSDAPGRPAGPTAPTAAPEAKPAEPPAPPATEAPKPVPAPAPLPPPPPPPPAGEAKPDPKGDVKAEPAKPEPAKPDPAKPDPAKPEAPKADPKPIKRKVIRNGEMEFEVDSFETAVGTVTRIAAEEEGFVGTVNSDKLPNGKVRGTVIVRCPPERLDTLVLKLRSLGTLNGSRLSAVDVTKQFTDLESNLRALRAMEERLLSIIKDGKGAIKDILEAEKLLGVKRAEIEKIEGELRYLTSLVSLSTLTLTLTEKDIRKPATVTETERVNLGLESDEVETAYRAALEAVAKAKGRVLESRLDKLPAGQFTALIRAEAPPAESGPLLDKLKLLGRVSRLDIGRSQTLDGEGIAPDAKVKRADTVFALSIYNLANIAPRETVLATVAAADPEAAYRKLLERIRKAEGRVITSTLDRQKNDQVVGRLQFEIKTAGAEAEAVLDEVKAAGEMVKLNVAVNSDTANVTAAKRGFNLTLMALGVLPPRQTQTVRVASRDVTASYNALLEAVKKAGGRVLTARLDQRQPRNVAGTLEFEVRREDEPAVADAVKAAGELLSRDTQRSEGENVVESKVRFQVGLVPAGSVPPRETVTLEVEAESAEAVVGRLAKAVDEAKGRTVVSRVSVSGGRSQAEVEYEVPLSALAGVESKFREPGTRVRSRQTAVNAEVPEGELTVARVRARVFEAERIVPAEDGVWPQVKQGLIASVQVLGWSLAVVVFGLLAVLPWVLVLWGLWRLLGGGSPSAKKPAAATAEAASPSAPPPSTPSA